MAARRRRRRGGDHRPGPPAHGDPLSTADPAAGPVSTVGILGAGRAGTALARALARMPRLSGTAAPRVLLASTAPPARLRHHLRLYAPQAEAVEPGDVAAAELTVLAVPRDVLDEVDPSDLAGPSTRALVDMTNSWEDAVLPAALRGPPTPGHGAEAESRGGPGGGLQADTLALAAHLRAHGLRAPLVRAFFDVSHHALDQAGRAEPPRAALAVGADPGDEHAAGLVAALVERMGFDAVRYTGLSRGLALEPGAPGGLTARDLAGSEAGWGPEALG